jgi:hypothetical protein
MGIMRRIFRSTIRTLYRVSKACKATFPEATPKHPREFQKSTQRRKEVQGVLCRLGEIMVLLRAKSGHHLGFGM